MHLVLSCIEKTFEVAWPLASVGKIPLSKHIDPLGQQPFPLLRSCFCHNKYLIRADVIRLVVTQFKLWALTREVGRNIWTTPRQWRGLESSRAFSSMFHKLPHLMIFDRVFSNSVYSRDFNSNSHMFQISSLTIDSLQTILCTIRPWNKRSRMYGPVRSSALFISRRQLL